MSRSRSSFKCLIITLHYAVHLGYQQTPLRKPNPVSFSCLTSLIEILISQCLNARQPPLSPRQARCALKDRSRETLVGSCCLANTENLGCFLRRTSCPPQVAHLLASALCRRFWHYAFLISEVFPPYQIQRGELHQVAGHPTIPLSSVDQR
jgi:hypothetical protein